MTPDAATVEAIRARHYKISFDVEQICVACHQEWPCDVVILLALHAQAVAEVEQQTMNWRNDFQLACQQRDQAEQALDAAVREEREACAKLADSFDDPSGPTDTGKVWRKSAGTIIARTIRARGAQDREET